ncbi:hypothetical protein DYB37_009417 [Aphanomyces astaci]|uniref:Uncharacterized protein n=1 Tax=Aphanomyces astaci TaxID=112090 RepID=A0A397DJ23_APHAT|nr:hypothetical protein DYB25_009433 [Aphanomyces astaci]RHY52851.1 hypothetical protein DYB34_009179 [Aphanomyces astaci]RHY66198.1 hypothetical protein DYB38_006501 [Aphanomyces astaci]RHY72990.1 hypothetical protein DYB30_010370 [Aphanomyces astaci]RHY80636.1 hypothetical protein DYB35_011755 [Aphanomyces astaci]
MLPDLKISIQDHPLGADDSQFPADDEDNTLGSGRIEFPADDENHPSSNTILPGHRQTPGLKDVVIPRSGAFQGQDFKTIL